MNNPSSFTPMLFSRHVFIKILKNITIIWVVRVLQRSIHSAAFSQQVSLDPIAQSNSY